MIGRCDIGFLQCMSKVQDPKHIKSGIEVSTAKAEATQKTKIHGEIVNSPLSVVETAVTRPAASGKDPQESLV